MSKTLNLSDGEARTVHHLVENEIAHMNEGTVPEDEEYREELENILSKL